MVWSLLHIMCIKRTPPPLPFASLALFLSISLSTLLNSWFCWFFFLLPLPSAACCLCLPHTQLQSALTLHNRRNGFPVRHNHNDILCVYVPFCTIYYNQSVRSNYGQYKIHASLHFSFIKRSNKKKYIKKIEKKTVRSVRERASLQAIFGSNIVYPSWREVLLFPKN